MDLAPWNIVFGLQISSSENRKGCLESAETHLAADQILRRINSCVSVHPHLRETKKSARKNRDSGEGHPSTLGHQVRRQGKLANIEFALLQHPLVAVLPMLQRTGLTHF